MNICRWLLVFVSSLGFAANTEVQEECKRATVPLVAQIPGWCSQQKAAAMMDLVFQVNPKICVEIGVYAGASFLPTAAALKCLGHGIIYAIDPWDNYEAVRLFPPENAHYQYWSSINFYYVFGVFQNLIETHGLEKHCCVMRMTSAKAAPLLRSIDILHIDSSHCDESALNDVLLYIPKVKVGGYIWFEAWDGAPNAFEVAKKNCHVKKVLDSGRCVLLEKIEG